jgi:hypothetical protein
MRARDLTQDDVDELSRVAGLHHRPGGGECPHCAWLDSMDADERLVVETTGFWPHLLMISLIKRWLMREKMTAGLRLQLLEHLQHFTEFLQAGGGLVEPADDATEQIYREAFSLRLHGTADDYKPVFNMLERWEVRWTLIRLNPSLLAAMRAREAERYAPRH